MRGICLRALHLLIHLTLTASEMDSSLVLIFQKKALMGGVLDTLPGVPLP